MDTQPLPSPSIDSPGVSPPLGSTISLLDSFDIDHLPDLDTVVMGALELFEQQPLPTLNLSHYHHPLVVGSGNAEATGRIIFDKSQAVFASESNYLEALRTMPEIDSVVVLSASGSKHAPAIVDAARAAHKPVTLITNTPNSPAHASLDLSQAEHEYVFPKNREPYTYNTSTYMGMILGNTHEDPAVIRRFINERIATIEFPDFGSYDKYYLIVPPQFHGIKRMLEIKFIELFGRNIARDIETSEYVIHATTVAPARELFISFGETNSTWGDPQNRLTIPLPDGAGYGAMMAVGYYIVAQIQKAHPQYFKDNIVEYTKKVSELFGREISAIVDK
ncbi:hypothetical protein IPF89_03870 [Candidatus Saccharibacteria bacterium]|nr:MAG: hypothetical protein IPF89_03870 [Candidatus Saccharibacteria bacterium]